MTATGRVIPREDNDTERANARQLENKGIASIGRPRTVAAASALRNFDVHIVTIYHVHSFTGPYDGVIA